ncbi:SulP family inorganic anion transporter [Pseudodesulfovibrio piezophilus]|uniref:Sulfate transporter ybaR n=1 Tax=Pseudodesulfovibrio piezophilus (strain DSM 21447 / JCM 15486 / C1TLV30) TaxID=1322246 RepID=M1WYF4_PSEP2|nr:SulP family inorganic anion transporter [Pseudodesulfovibrio piezophilus]CCH50313.1 sulfate transporter ybaR [Pseudodesulfovibrio piezophilus C1TLV30]
MEASRSFVSRSEGSAQSDIFSGLTVALALVPEAVAFSFVAGVPPMVGLYGAFMMCLVTSVLGGRPGMISGATGAMAVVMVNLVLEGNALGGAGSHAGLQYLFFTLLLVGILQSLAGIFSMGKFIRMVPRSVMMGFVNGLAIVIFLSQLKMFQSGGEWLEGRSLLIMVGLVVLTMTILFLVPKVHKKSPGALIAIISVSLLVLFVGIDTETVLSFVQSNGGSGIKAGLPSFAIPSVPFTWNTLVFVTPYAFILAAIGLIESLMTLSLIDELTDTHGHGNRECIAQGAGNFINGLFGGMGGCAMIGQSIINITSGGRGRLSGLVAAAALLFFILFTSEYIEQIPIAALTGVMFIVVIKTFAWSTFNIMNKIPKWDVGVIVLVTFLTVKYDLAIAVICGVIISALIFAWENALRIRARKMVDEHGIKHYQIYGPLFFASTALFMSKFDVSDDPDEVIIDFQESRIMDQSAIETINKLTEMYHRSGKTIHLWHLSKDCVRLIKKAEKICVVNVLEDPDYFVGIDDYRKYREHVEFESL